MRLLLSCLLLSVVLSGCLYEVIEEREEAVRRESWNQPCTTGACLKKVVVEGTTCVYAKSTWRVAISCDWSTK